MNHSAFSHRPLFILIGTIVLISIWNWAHGLDSWMPVPAEAENAWASLKSGDFSSGVIGELATLFGAAFLHADGGHLIYNLLFLWIFGAAVLQICGARWFFTFFILTAIGGSIGHILLNSGSNIPMLGASGAVMGLEGAYLGLAVKKERPNPHIWPIAHPVAPAQLASVGVVGIILDFMGLAGAGAGIAYGAHIGGFVTGIILSLFRNG